MWLDRFGFILFDAALSTALFLSVVAVFMLVCRQPSRRLLIVRSSLLASLAMLPLVAVVPLPRLDILAMFSQPAFVPPSSHVESGKDNRLSPEQPSPMGRLHSFITVFQSDYAAWAGRWMPRSLTLIVLTLAATGTAWVLLGFWGVRWLLRHSQEPSQATQAVYDALSAGPESRATPAQATRLIGSTATGPGRVFSPHDSDSVDVRQTRSQHRVPQAQPPPRTCSCRTIGSLVRHDRQSGPVGLVFLASCLVVTSAANYGSRVHGR